MLSGTWLNRTHEIYIEKRGTTGGGGGRAAGEGFLVQATFQFWFELSHLYPFRIFLKPTG